MSSLRDGHQSAYEKEAAHIYGLLREAWERGLEEVLLGGIVERYRVGVQTQQIDQLADITTEDCKAVDNAMTKCSQWLPGHVFYARNPHLKSIGPEQEDGGNPVQNHTQAGTRYGFLETLGMAALGRVAF